MQGLTLQAELQEGSAGNMLSLPLASVQEGHTSLTSLTTSFTGCQQDRASRNHSVKLHLPALASTRAPCDSGAHTRTTSHSGDAPTLQPRSSHREPSLVTSTALFKVQSTLLFRGLRIK